MRLSGPEVSGEASGWICRVCLMRLGEQLRARSREGVDCSDVVRSGRGLKSSTGSSLLYRHGWRWQHTPWCTLGSGRGERLTASAPVTGWRGGGAGSDGTPVVFLLIVVKVAV